MNSREASRKSRWSRNTVFRNSQYSAFFILGGILFSTVKPRLTATSVIQSPLYYGHFFWPPDKTGIHFIINKKLSLMRSPVNTANFFGPLVTVLTHW